MAALISSFLFLFTLAGLCFLPGYFILKRFFGSSFPALNPWEKLLHAFGISLGFLIFGMILLGKMGVPFTPLSLLSLIMGGTLLLSLLFFSAERFTSPPTLRSQPWQFSSRQAALFFLIVGATILIKTVYLTHAIIPTATDLGHHMYWAKLAAETGELPVYAEQNIIQENDQYRIAPPEPIADFIIGEHLPFAAIEIVAHPGFFSAFPVTFLALINLLALFAMATLAAALVRGLRVRWLSPTLWTGENAFLLTLLLMGPLYTLASPQEKFVSGGVVGNTFGLFFIPLILLSFYRGLRENEGRFFALGLFFTFTLAYIHHLSTFVLGFALMAIAILYLLIHFRNIGTVLKSWSALLARPYVLGMLAALLLFFFLVAMPTYIETGAVSTAVGTPTKNTRIGLSLSQITDSAGQARVALGLAGLALLAFLPWRRRYAAALLLGWGIITLIMTLRPQWLFIDIPSNRIGAYVSLPLSIIAAVAALALFAFLKRREVTLPIPKSLAFIAFCGVFIYALGSGALENTAVLLPESKAEGAVATFHASRFLAEETGPEDMIVKDHNYIAADAWMKLFFLRDYSFPLSRAYFSRYEDNPDREHCTLYMISTPNTPQGDKCYDETGTNIVVVSSAHDAAQFEASDDFSKVYTTKYISIFRRQHYAD